MGEERSDEEILWERAMRASRRQSIVKVVAIVVVAVAVAGFVYFVSRLGARWS